MVLDTLFFVLIKLQAKCIIKYYRHLFASRETFCFFRMDSSLTGRHYPDSAQLYPHTPHSLCHHSASHRSDVVVGVTPGERFTPRRDFIRPFRCECVGDGLLLMKTFRRPFSDHFVPTASGNGGS